MEEKEKEYMDRNENLLVHNIILTEEFYNELRWSQVLPESMISDVQSYKTREEQVKHLLYTLKLRGCDSFRKFRHVLHMTGHHLLADQLYEEENEYRLIKGKDLFNKFPSVFSQVSDEIKVKIVRHLETKMMEKALVKIWNKMPTERLEALENKKSAFIQERDLRTKLENKRKQVTNLKEDVSDLDEKLKKKELEQQAMSKEREEIRKKFKAELAVQARFNAANNSSIIRLREKFVTFNEKVRVLNRMIGEFLAGDGNNCTYDPSENVKFSRLEQNVKTVMHIARENHDAIESKANERDMVLTMLKRSNNTNESLADVVKKFIEKDEKAKIVVFKEVEKLLELMRKNKPQYKNKNNSSGVDMKYLRNMVATVRVEVEHLKKKLEWKDDQITDLIKETMMLRQNKASKERNTVSETLKGAIVSSPVSSPDSTYEMQVAYKRFDDYLSHSPALPERNRRRGSLADVDLEPDPDEIDISYIEQQDYQPRVRFPEVEIQSGTKPSLADRRFSLLSEKELSTIFETDDNEQFEKFVTHIAKKTQPTKLPLICKDVLTDHDGFRP